MTESNNKWIKFSKGNLANLSLYMTEEYAKNYENGDTDHEMIRSIEEDLPNGKTIFDVGAWIGSSSLVFSKLVGAKGTVVAFEPNPYNLKRMKINLKKNPNFADRINIFTYALSDNNKSTRMFLSKNVDNGHSSTSRIDNSHSTIQDEALPQGFVGLDVESKKLDDFIKETSLKPDIIKVDIEGAEHLFLMGALDTLITLHPTLYIEIHSEYCAIRCYEILSNAGYIITILKEEVDNRIMVKAQYSTEKDKTNVSINIWENVLNIQSTQDLILRQMKRINFLDGRLHTINNQLIIKDQEIANLRNDKDLLKIDTETGKRELEKILNSKSWKITKPVRNINSAIKSIKH